MPGPMRGAWPNNPVQHDKVGLPPRPFLYTIDQIAVLLDVEENQLKRLLYYEGRSIGAAARSLMTARNIAPPNEKPDWRVAERELVRWLRFKGFKYYERGTFTH